MSPVVTTQLLIDLMSDTPRGDLMRVEFVRVVNQMLGPRPRTVKATRRQRAAAKRRMPMRSKTWKVV